MHPERWQRVESLLDAAFELSDAERDAFLRRETHGEPELMAEVLAILRA